MATHIACLNSGKRFYTSDQNGNLYQFNSESNRLEKKYTSNDENTITSMTASFDSKNLIICFSNGKIKTFSVLDDNNEPELTFIYDFEKTFHNGSVTTTTTSSSGFLFSGDPSGRLNQSSMLYMKHCKLCGTINKKGISSLKCDSDSRYVFVGGHDGCLQQYSIRDGKIVRSFGKVSKNEIRDTCLSHDGRWLLVIDSKGQVYEFDQQRFCNDNSSI